MASTDYRKQFDQLSKEHKAVVKEMADNLERGYQDPVFFINYFLGIPLHKGQEKYARESDVVWNKNSSRKNLLAPCNRWGKTVLISCLHIRQNFYKIGVDRETMSLNALRDVRYKTLDLSPHSNQMEACYNYIYDILHSRFIIVQDGKRSTNKCKIKSFFVSKNDSKHRIEFANKSTFCGASTGEDQGSSLAGAQFGLITYDECVFSLHLRTELPGRIMSRTVDMNAPIHLISTFDSDATSQQYYFGLVRKSLKKQNDWYCQIGTYEDNVFLPREVIEESKKKILAEDFNKYRQVFLGEAVPASTKIFEPEIIDNIFKKDLKPEQPFPLRDYLISVDWGGSDQGDPTVMFVLDYTNLPYRIVHHEIIKGGNPTLTFALLKVLKESYNDANIIMDTNSLGGVIIKKLLADMNVKTYDFNAHGGEKGEAITQLKLVLTWGRNYTLQEDKIVELSEFGKLVSYYIPEVEEQLGSYEINDKHLEQDCVSALYQAAWWLEKKYRQPNPTTYIIKRHIGDRGYATTS